MWSAAYFNTIKTNFMGIASPSHFGMIFEKNVSNIKFYYVTKFHCLIAFPSRDIGEYFY